MPALLAEPIQTVFDKYQQSIIDANRGVDPANIQTPDYSAVTGGTVPESTAVIPPNEEEEIVPPAATKVTGTSGIVNKEILTEESKADFTPSTPAPGEGIGEHTPTTITPKPESTVQGQMGTLLDKESSYMQLARTKALQQANARGLVNSSIAVGASQDAAIRAGLPIAQQDAATQFQAQTANQQAENQIIQNEQAFDINQSLKEQEQRQYLERLDFDAMTKEDQARLNTQLEMLSDENKATLQAEMEAFVKDAEVTATQKQLFAQESAKILVDTQNAIKEINIDASKSMTAAQQGAAIEHVLLTQDAQLKLLKDLMLNSSSWTW